eukprot:Phypoly_transcript_18740.p1 GENE.Phypoly_transcript_18740~~Phypoly_transcript_18740.p1  ORF type:complete len:148 (+),score=15.07 Phypoly_transcript_18740:75-518(+)
MQGPFQGVASSFINFLSSVHTPIDVYLCGWDTGLATIFSILETLKDNISAYNVRSICCLFNAIRELDIARKAHSHISDLVQEWQSPIVLTIVESEDCDLGYIHLMAARPAFWNRQCNEILAGTISKQGALACDAQCPRFIGCSRSFG